MSRERFFAVLIFMIASLWVPQARGQASTRKPALNLDTIVPVPYESMNESNPAGDKLAIPRRIAAAIVAQDHPIREIADVCVPKKADVIIQPGFRFTSR